MKKYLSIILGLILLAGSSFATEVKVISIEGEVEVTSQQTMKPKKPKVDMLLAEGTKVVTKEDSSIELAFNADSTNVVKVSENSHVVLKLDGDEKIELIDGELYAVLKNLKKGETFQVRTPCAVCGARGTGWQMSTDKKFTNVSTFENKVFLQGINPDGTVMKKKYWVKKGYERKVEKFKNPGRTEKISKERMEKLKDMVKVSKTGNHQDTMKARAAIIEKKENLVETNIDSIRDVSDFKRIENERKEPPKKESSRSPGYSS